MRVQTWIGEKLNWILYALQTRVDAEEVLGGNSNISKEIVKILETELKPEYEQIKGKLPDSNPKLSLSRTGYYDSRKKTITMQVPEKYIDIIEYMQKEVNSKRALGVQVTLGEELLSLIDQKLYEEKRELWLANAKKLGYNVEAVKPKVKKIIKIKKVSKK